MKHLKQFNESVNEININLGIISMDFISAKDLINDEIWNILWELSWYKHEIGFDFITDKKIIKNYIRDIKDDGINHPDTKHLEYLNSLVNNMKTEHLYIKQ